MRVLLLRQLASPINRVRTRKAGSSAVTAQRAIARQTAYNRTASTARLANKMDPSSRSTASESGTSTPLADSATAATSKQAQLSLEHDPSTPDVLSAGEEEEEEEDIVEVPIALTSSAGQPIDDTTHLPVNATSTSDNTANENEPANEAFIFGASTRLGGRILHEGRDPWSHNAWDNVQWDEEQEEAALKAIEKQQKSPIPAQEQEKLNATPARYWDLFYKNVEDKFFKDRSWLCQEFDALSQTLLPDAGPKVLAEIGCGTGATAYPLIAKNQNPDLFFHCFDYSPRAVGLVKSNAAYDPQRINAEVWSVCDPNGLSPGVQPNSVDVATLVFCLSALHPSEWRQAMDNIHLMLKPGGYVCFRDYGRNDLTQLRFKSARFMEPNLYARGDKTRVYFFTKDELESIFSPAPDDENATQARFDIVKLGVDRRLLMNRKRKLKMYRIWMQGIFQKPSTNAAGNADV